jgi:transcriptional regulator with AbiEi antitoxin domain of type IV toxin-antitoxin system
MATKPRSVPRSIARVLEALELDQPTLVTLSRLEELVNETGSPTSAANAVRLLRERGWLLPLRTSGVWEFAPGARAGAWGGGDPFIELRARLATRPIETAVAAESAAWLHGLSSRSPEPHVIALAPGANLPKSLDGYRVVRWSAVDPVVDADGLPLWSVTTLLAFMGTRPQKYRDWPNVSEWLVDGAARVSVEALRAELTGQPRSAWARTSYLLFRGGHEASADELLSSAPPGRGPFHFGPRDMPSKYVARFEVIDHVFPTWWSIKATT